MPDLKMVIFDLERRQENFVSYSAMEQVKNGCFFSSKYESEIVVFNYVHVVVFANFAPDLQALSADRWNITNITPKRPEAALLDEL